MSEEPIKKPFEDDIAIRGRMDIEDIVRLQINRCNASAYEPDETLFASSVLVLLDLLPSHKRNQVLEEEMEYTEKVKFIEYGSYWCGRPMTSTKQIVERFVRDYHKLYRIVLDAYAESGLTWQIEPELVEKGRVMKKKSEPTPYKKDKNNAKS